MDDGLEPDLEVPRFERTNSIELVRYVPTFSEEALALRFAERHEEGLRYVAVWNRWLTYNGKRWNFDDTLFAFDQARKICRGAASECKNRKLGSMLASAKTVAAIERLAKADRRIAARVEQWDADPWLL